ncbi:MAG: LysR family transcriptional regulator, partial [Trichococcus sp.]
MEMKDIEYVKAINDCGSLTRAAESLYISQPSLSMYIKNMQARLGFPVFNQIGKKYELTFLGERFLAAGIEILRMRENFYDEAAHILDNKIGRLRVSIPFMRGSYLAPDILPKFNEIYPNIEVELIEESSKVVEEKINNGEADIAIMNMPHHALNLDFEIIKSEEILLAVPSGHPCINQGKPNPKSSYPSIDLH